jgi:hypothetical protein
MRAERLGAHPRPEVERWKALGRQEAGRKPKKQRPTSRMNAHGDGEPSGSATEP